ncbi:MAG: iron ABC transporter permease [Ignavibacteria bacterium]|nr:iron ABC transporter permease [Ignavibacteria bacterium]
MSLMLGKYQISPMQIAAWGISHVNTNSGLQIKAEIEMILSQIRMPRILLVSLVGAGLAVSGTVLQSIFRNPLVSPYILGISSGSAFGVSLVILLFQVYNPFLLQLSAFLFGSLSVTIVLIASKLFPGRDTIIMVLTGIIISSFFSASVSLIQYFTDDQKIQTILFWTFGSFANANWENVFFIAPILLLCGTLFILKSWKLNVLSLGEVETTSLGLDYKRQIFTFIILTSIITSSVTAVCGPIGWVGLIIPHIVRFLGGSNNTFVVPCSLVSGAIFLQCIDLIARYSFPFEIPVGIVAALIGLPFFIFVLIKIRVA